MAAPVPFARPRGIVRLRRPTDHLQVGWGRRVARVLGLVAGKPIESAIDLTTVKVVTRLESVPWDCVVQELARQLELEVVLEADRIRLVPPVSAGSSAPD